MHPPAQFPATPIQAGDIVARARELAAQARLVALHLGETSTPLAEATRSVRCLAAAVADAAQEIEARGSANLDR